MRGAKKTTSVVSGSSNLPAASAGEVADLAGLKKVNIESAVVLRCWRR